MSEIKLSKRLGAAAEFVRRDKTVCDVGTDHALLPCFLYQRGVKNIIACDVNDGPLLAAKDTIDRYIGNCDIKLIKSDGLRNIDFAEDIVIAGMGGELIARIVCECGFLTTDTRFILQPMTKAEFLRTELYANGFEITEEKTVTDMEKLYVVMLVRYTGVKQKISAAFSYTGLVRDKQYLQKQATALFKAAESCKNADEARYRFLYDTAAEIQNKSEEV